MLKKWFNTLDANQKDTVVSTALILAITLLIELIFKPEIGIIFIFPLQYLITYFGFVRGTVTKSKGWYVHKRSGIKWKKRHWVSNISLGCVIASVIFIGGMYNPPSWLVFIAFIAPLLISRLIIFVKKFPLGALYWFDAQVAHTANEAGTTNSEIIDIVSDPSYSWHSGNIYHIEHKHH